MATHTSNYSDHGFLVSVGSPILRDTIQTMLVRWRVSKIVHAANGVDAVKELREARGRIDCVLCDWNMEPVSGLELLKTIRAGNVRHTPQHLRFIALLDASEETEAPRALALGADVYVVKPLSLKNLDRAIAAALASLAATRSAGRYP